MRHLIAALLCALLGMPASAGCRSDEPWHGPDKQMHLLGGAGVAFVATLHTGDPWRGFALGAGVSVGKEVVDLAIGGRCSLQDAAIGVLGAGIAAYTGGLVVTRVQGRTVIGYATTF